MDLLVEHKWLLLAGTEVALWALSFAFVALRHLFDLERTSVLVLALVVLNELAVAGLLAFARTGEFDAYGAVVLAILVYGLTLGKRDFERLDAYPKHKVAAWRGEGAR